MIRAKHCILGDLLQHQDANSQANQSSLYLASYLPSLKQLHMADSYGDGWNGNMWNWADPSGTVADATGTLSGASGTAKLCIPVGLTCMEFSLVDPGGSTYPGEVSWYIEDGAGTTILSVPFLLRPFVSRARRWSARITNAVPPHHCRGVARSLRLRSGLARAPSTRLRTRTRMMVTFPRAWRTARTALAQGTSSAWMIAARKISNGCPRSAANSA